MSTENEEDLLAEAVELLHRLRDLGMRFEVGTAYISRRYVDEQDALRERIAELMKAYYNSLESS